MRNFNIRQAKLIIWDLDETFWDGVLSEGDIQFKPEICEFVDNLVSRGIMNSICSKNNYNLVKSIFLNKGYSNLWNNFLFPSISWTPKGQRVKEIISKMQLREENVIFIDDNETNLQEVMFYCPKIMTANNNQIKNLINELYTVNSYDLERTRLSQYKILEKKDKIKNEQFSSNEEFLRNSEIKISFNYDCKNNIKRILELINRTNQLNFTKKRIDENTLKRDIENENYESSFITVKDKYGNYGICGFYTLDKINNKLVHFLFSCRIMSMGIEQFVYKYINFPQIDIIGEVASNLTSMNPDWIEISDNISFNADEKKNNEYNDIKILFKGSCDLLSTLDYINPNCEIDTELAYWNKNLAYILAHTHTAFIEQTHSKTPEEIRKICMSFPFPQEDEFKTKFFEKDYNVIFLSLLSVTLHGLYINKNNGNYVVLGYANCDMTDEKNWEKSLATLPEEAKKANLEQLKIFKQDYEFAGNPPTNVVLKNLKYIRENLSETTELVLLLGSEIPTEKSMPGYEGLDIKHKELNRAVENFVKDYQNISIINFTDFIENDDNYTVCIDHFSRDVYAKIAQKIALITNEKTGKECLKVKFNF